MRVIQRQRVPGCHKTHRTLPWPTTVVVGRYCGIAAQDLWKVRGNSSSTAESLVTA